MSNTSGEEPNISSNRLPQGLTQEQFALLSLKLRQGVSHLGNDIRVHGSRASGSATPDSDIDIAIRVTPERFNEIINDPELSTLASPNTGSSIENTKLHARRGRKNYGRQSQAASFAQRASQRTEDEGRSVGN